MRERGAKEEEKKRREAKSREMISDEGRAFWRPFGAMLPNSTRQLWDDYCPGLLWRGEKSERSRRAERRAIVERANKRESIGDADDERR